MKVNRFFLLEPSKVGSQHITLIEGYLRSISASEIIKVKYELNLQASSETLKRLPEALISEFKVSSIPVMNPERRRLVRKSLLELYVIFRLLMKLRRNDVMFITCLLPTTLFLMEYVCRFFNKKNIYVLLHGEIEGVIDAGEQSIFRIGYWARKWARSRRVNSYINLVVLDDFIKKKLVDDCPEKFNENNVFVMHHPISTYILKRDVDIDNDTFCFIGYRTRNKGYPEFVRLALMHPEYTFLAIGDGIVENVSSGEVIVLEGKDDYLTAIAECSAAIFPYSAGYTCSLSAAALDAISTGVQIYSLDRPFFCSLKDYFGAALVTTVSAPDDFNGLILSHSNNAECDNKALRLRAVRSSKYGEHEVMRSFEKLLVE